MNKKEAATLAYNLICGLADINDSEFVDNIISAVQDGAEYDIEDMLIELEAGEYDWLYWLVRAPVESLQ